VRFTAGERTPIGESLSVQILFARRVPSGGVEIVHQRDGGHSEGPGPDTVLATDVRVAESTLEQLKGVMFKPDLPEGYGLVFRFGGEKKRGVHMLFVRVPIDVIWTVGGQVTGVETLQPWTGYGRERADRIVELPAGAADSVAVGDRVFVRD
jgi:hypothetical protein